MMIFFNDPLPMDRPAERALRMAIAMRDQVRDLAAAGLARARPRPRRRHRRGLRDHRRHRLRGRWDYGAIGTVTNLAARLCGEAKAGQILVSPRVAGAAEDAIDLEPAGTLTLKDS